MRAIKPTSERIKKTLEYYKTLSYKDLNERDYSFLREHKVCNGCGGAGNGVKNRFIRFIIKKALESLRLIFIEASCDIHDFTYWQGGDEARRKECDLGFFTAIIADIGMADLGSLSVIKYTLIALIFYGVVRVGGKEYFNFTDM